MIKMNFFNLTKDLKIKLLELLRKTREIEHYFFCSSLITFPCTLQQFVEKNILSVCPDAMLGVVVLNEKFVYLDYINFVFLDEFAAVFDSKYNEKLLTSLICSYGFYGLVRELIKQN
jgi:hypothetical protein